MTLTFDVHKGSYKTYFLFIKYNCFSADALSDLGLCSPRMTRRNIFAWRGSNDGQSE